MNQKWEIEFIPVPISAQEYEEKQAKLVAALLALLENEPKQAEDPARSLPEEIAA